jgi:hypothetical protein
VLGEDSRAVGREDTGGVEEVLDREPDPVAGLELGDEDAVRSYSESTAIATKSSAR